MNKSLRLSAVIIRFSLFIVLCLPNLSNADDDMLLSIRECVEVNFEAALNERRYRDVQHILEQRCLGPETDRCYRETGGALLDRDYCVDDEATAWGVLRREFLDLLLSNPKGEATKTALLDANKAWEDSRSNDCGYVSLRWGRGTLSRSDQFECNRNKIASRAILYRIWLYDLRTRVEG